jgi:hypothetical protein
LHPWLKTADTAERYLLTVLADAPVALIVASSLSISRVVIFAAGRSPSVA